MIELDSTLNIQQIADRLFPLMENIKNYRYFLSFKFNGEQVQTKDILTFGCFLMLNGIKPGSFNIEEFIKIIVVRDLERRSKIIPKYSRL